MMIHQNIFMGDILDGRGDGICIGYKEQKYVTNQVCNVIAMQEGQCLQG